MDHHSLGSSGIEVSRLGFGCMSLELQKGQDHITRLLQDAYESGINFFDTADLYDNGNNELMVGKALKPIRNKVVIATKVGNVWREDGSGWDWKPSKELILTGVDESLKRLQTDYLDLYMLHGGTLDDPIEEIIEAFELLKDSGKIRAYGISSIRPNVIREYVRLSNIEAVMMQYSLLDRRPEESCLNLLQAHNISVLTRGSLAKGLLIDKAPRDYLAHSAREVEKMQYTLGESGNALSLALGYVLAHPAVASAVAGIRTTDQLNELLKQLSNGISDKQMDRLRSVLSPLLYEKHR